MFDFSKKLNGLELFFKEADYTRLHTCNDHYRSFMKSRPQEIPALFQKINAKKSTFPSNEIEQHFVLFKKITGEPGSISRHNHLRIVRQLATLYERDADMLYCLGQSLVLADHYADGLHYLEQTVQVKPSYAGAWMLISIIAAIANDHSRSIRGARRVLQLGHHRIKLMSRAYVFGRLLLGQPTRTDLYSSRPCFDDETFADQKDKTSSPNFTIEIQPTVISSAPIIMFACDSGYFQKYGKNLLLSLAQSDAAVTMHVHLVGPQPKDMAWLQEFNVAQNNKLIVSTERGLPPKSEASVYWASARFVYIHEFMTTFDRPYLIVDADTLLNSAETLTSFLGEATKPTFYVSEQDNPLWDTISAPFLYLTNNKIGLAIALELQEYLQRVFFTKSGWGVWYVDQLALLASCLKHINEVQLFRGGMLSSTSCDDNAMFWTLSNNKAVEKFQAKSKMLAENK